MIGKCKHNITQELFSMSFTIISKRSYWQKFTIIKKIVFRAFFYTEPLTVLILLKNLNVKEKSWCWNRCCSLPTLAHQEFFCNKPRTLLSSLYVHLTQCAKLLCKHLEANLKHLLGMELATDVIFLVLLPEIMIYLFIYLLQVRAVKSDL